jgi:hypothetical protein
MPPTNSDRANLASPTVPSTRARKGEVGATRYEKTTRRYLAPVQVTCAWLWLD